MNRVARLLVLAWVFALPASGSELLRLQGHVIGWNGDPLPGTKLTLEIEGQEARVLVVDESGDFRFEGLPEGPYRLTVEAPGIASFQHSAVLDRRASREMMLIECTPEEGGKVRSLPPLETGGDLPPPPPAAPPPPPAAPPPPEPDKGFAEVEVFYGTDRALKRDAPVEERFGPERMRWTGIHLGACKVSVPRDHRSGQIERPSIWKLEVTPDPRKHMVLLGMEELGPETFYKRLQGNLKKSQAKELLVFVHGYNVAFHDAVLRTAQLAYDLGIDGAPVLYSWPSQASLSKYTVDEANVEWTVPHLERFLRDLAGRSGARSVYLIAHSMGNRALTRALERIAGKMDARTKPLFSEILLTAPDIDAAVFADLAQIFRRTGGRVTLYASSNDEALKLSKKVHGYPRAGESGPGVVVLSGIDTIDVSAVDTSLLGHSYFGDNTTVIADMFNLLRERQPPERRSGLKKKEKAAGLVYWVFSP